MRRMTNPTRTTTYEPLRRRMIVESPQFSLADRVLAQAGITVSLLNG
jgi:hypothetical protein